MTYKTYEVTFQVDTSDGPPQPNDWVVIPPEVSITELKPVFEPGYFIDMSLPDEERQLYFGDTPRYVDWFDEEPLQGEGANWVRVNVTDMNF